MLPSLVEALTASVVDAIARGDAVGPDALRFVLRRYRDTDRADLGDAVGQSLAVALERYLGDSATPSRAAWLLLFTEAATLSDDPRLIDAGSTLMAGLASEWSSAAVVDEAATSIDACLVAADAAGRRDLIVRAIDELERIVGGAYRPGAGVAHSVGVAPHVHGGFGDQVCAARALLTAYEISGRLPYSMLAEELMHLSLPDADAGVDFVLDCEAARVFCRLAALHDNEEYRRAAIVADAAEYWTVAGRILARLSDVAAGRGIDAAVFGLALAEYMAAHQRLTTDD